MIGTALKAQLTEQGHQIRTLTRSDGGDYRWNARPGSVPPQAIAWADAVVSLGGASLTRLPWTRSYRHEIERSRVESTMALAEAIADAGQRPQVWVSASAVGYYGDRADAPLDESSPVGDGFLARVVRAWELATGPALGATRVVLARTGLVLSTEGALRPLAATTRWGLGARLGSGQQWWPWIALADEVRAIDFVLSHSEVCGAVNLVGPHPATAQSISRALAAALGRPHALVVPAGVLRLVLGGADELLLSSQQVRPAKLLEAGFAFQYARAEDVIRQLW
jgi:uncharacterized protein (TIGR01777 family)